MSPSPQRPRPPAISAHSLYRSITALRHTVRCADVLEKFLGDPALFALPVVDELDTPLAIVERHAFVEFFGKPFTPEVHGRKTILQLLQLFQVLKQRPIIVDVETRIDDIARIVVDAGLEHLIAGFIVTREGQYLGLGNIHDLLNELTRAKQEALYHMAHYDQLTGIANRMLLLDRLEKQSHQLRRSGDVGALLMIDLDRFKQVNDSFGHSFGDALLREVAVRLCGCAREGDTVARIGGDEFALLMAGMSSPQAAHLVAHRVVEACMQPFEIFGRVVNISASVGIAPFPRAEDSPEAILIRADTAMYEIKRGGRNGFTEYSDSFQLHTAESFELENDLRHAIERGELRLQYQPQFCIEGKTVLGVEALLRWQHPIRGMVPPVLFIEIAEQSGLIVPIGAWVLREACRQQVAWCRAGLPPLRMAVNISPLQFDQADFCDYVRELIEETGIQPNLLELEMTERIVMKDSTLVQDVLENLRLLGIRLAIDDFGTGFSSLNYLRRFPISRLKIDQSFVRDVDCIPVNESIVRAIVTLAKSLSQSVIAEGVQTAAEHAVLRACGCEEVQGFRFGRPQLPDSFESWFKTYLQEDEHALL